MTDQAQAFALVLVQLDSEDTDPQAIIGEGGEAVASWMLAGQSDIPDSDEIYEAIWDAIVPPKLKAKIVHPRIAALRSIVEQHQAQEVEGVLVDAFSASAYLKIHDGLSPDNQADLNDRNLSSAMGVVWAIVEKRRARA